MSKLQTYLALGRVSNLPTVWTNTLSAWALSGTPLAVAPLGLLVLGFSLFYVAGMYLNDVADSEIDALERPTRPIPAGLVSRQHVLHCAIGLMLAAVVCLATARLLAPAAQQSGHSGWLVCTALLVAAILGYNRYHKGNPCSPLIMGACRVMVLFCGSVILSGTLSTAVLFGAVLLYSYLIGLTWIARFEVSGGLRTGWPALLLVLPVMAGLAWSLQSGLTGLPVALLTAVVALALYRVNRNRPGDIPRSVGLLIAGIAVLDAILLAAFGQATSALLAVGAFGLTLALQRRIAGT